MLTITKDEYDELRYYRHEYLNLSEEFEELILLTDELKYLDTLKLDNEKLNDIVRRYFKECYLERIEEIREEEKND